MDAEGSVLGPSTRLPARPEGVLHGVPLRPPAMRWDGRHYGGSRLLSLDVPGALPGVVEVVQRQSFVGVVAVSAVLARQAADTLQPVWQAPEAAAGRAAPTPDAPAYVWQVPARSAGDGAAAVAWCVGGQATVWAPVGPADHPGLVEELARTLGMPADRVTVVDVDAASFGTLHVLDVLDAAVDAALMSHAVQRPVQVAVRGPAATAALSLQPIGTPLPDAAGQVPDGRSAASPSAEPSHVVWQGAGPWAVRPSLARLLSQPLQAGPSALPTAQSAIGMGTPVSAAAGSDLSNAAAADLDAAQVFAQEVWLDEQAARAGDDPLAYRLDRLDPGPGRRLTKQMAARAAWQVATAGPDPDRATSLIPAAPARHLRGRGFASARVHARAADGRLTETWSAWVADVAVDAVTGHIDVTRVVVGRDGQALSAAQTASIHTDDPRLLDAARRLLAAPTRFDDWNGLASNPSSGTGHATALANAGTDSLAAHAPADAVVATGQIEADGVVTLPAAAAIANAIFDATGVRLRQVPFEAETVRQALVSAQAPESSTRRWMNKGRGWLVAGAGLVAAAAGLIAMAWPAKPAIAPTDGPDLSVYSEAAIERGRLVAAAGDCMVCHTAPNGTPNAGGLGLETPFGVIYSTNITPDLDTGIGRWSYGAFERAMREGVHRDGRQLYPAFPYTAFAKMTDADMQALYAYLMTQPAVASEPPKTELAFPYNVRAGLAGWNLLFHENKVYQPDPTQSLEWNRGAYLVEGAGHCGACHTPRNALGAEKTGIGNRLAGGEAEGWVAPALNRLASADVPWTAEELSQYLSTGFSARHGVAAGPMAPVIHGLAQLPESDVRAISTYLLNLPGSPAPQRVAAEPVKPAAAPAAATVFQNRANGERIYQNACAVCHEAGSGPTLFGVKPRLDASTSLHADTPTNLIQVILHGIQEPANGDLGYMPGFGDSLDDQQIADLLGYLRERFAPEKKAWTDDTTAIGRLRTHAHAPEP